MLKKQSRKKLWFTTTIIPVVCLGLLSCSNVDSYSNNSLGGIKEIIDPDANLNREAYQNMLPDTVTAQEEEQGSSTKRSKAEPQIPDTTEILATPKPPEIGPDKLVSVSVTEDVPLKDVLIELSRLADVDMEIDPGITGGIILKVTNKPFSEVMASVVELGKLRYENNNGTLKVERDLPYQVNYVTDFLNIVRSSTGNVNIDTNVIGSGSGSSNAGSTTNSSSSSTSSSGSSSSSSNLSSGSSNQIQSSYDGDLWASIEKGINSIISASTTSSASATSSTSSSTSTTSTTSSSGSSVTNSLNINKQAGIISVVANSKQHKDIESYLSSVKKSVSSQVLIEAKIVEVTLNKEYRSGIDWGTLADSNFGVKLTGNFKGDLSTSTDFITLQANTFRNITTAMSMLGKFGTSRTLSSPRLHAMNNQQAVLTFAENNVYFTLEVQEKTDNTATTTNAATTLTVQSNLNTVPIGVILSLQPSINLDTNEVTMNIRPTLSRITGTVNDPGVDVIVARQKALTENSDAFANVVSKVPVIEVRELDSILKVKSGDVMIIGGLMKDVSTNTDTGVPGLSRIPVFGNAFKSVVKENETIETVIFIKATIVQSDGFITKADKAVYKNFSRDPRPLAF